MNDTPDDKCPVCLGANGVLCKTLRTGVDSSDFDCQSCGRFDVTGSALTSWLSPRRARLSAMHRAALSHVLRSGSRVGTRTTISTSWIEHFTKNARLPSPSEQATNLIRLLGDSISETGENYPIDDVAIASLVGSFNAQLFGQLRSELEAKGLITKLAVKDVKNPRGSGVLVLPAYGLTLDGWDRYESEKRGQFAGSYGFIAMKFGDAVLDAFVQEVIKPAAKEGTGFDLVDLRDVARAGVIDNIMRQQIRDAAFVLVDLTHDNSGAYWEAGYAEGLGKPVIYLCEQSKFDSAKTHFDTNHCTTVKWEDGAADRFRAELIATLRRSLNLF